MIFLHKKIVKTYKIIKIKDFTKINLRFLINFYIKNLHL